MNIGQTIIDRLDLVTISLKSSLKREYNHASETGWANVCMRRLVLLRTCPEKQAEHGVALLRKFEEGHRQEKLIVEELKSVPGFEVLNAGDDKEVLLIPDYKIACELDATLKIDGGEPLITEIKSCDPGFFRLVKTNRSGSDLLKSNSFYLNLYPPQLWTQMLARKESKGIWIYKNRSTGEKHIIETDFENEGLDYMARTLDRISTVNRLVDDGKAPDATPCDGCSRCSFYAHCFDGPIPMVGSERVELIQNEDMDSKITEWRALRRKIDPVTADIKALEKIEKDLKDTFKGKNALISGVSVRVKSKYPMKVYNIPDEIKEKYLSYADVFRMVIEDLNETL